MYILFFVSITAEDQKIYEIEWQELAEAEVEEAAAEKWLVLHHEASKSHLCKLGIELAADYYVAGDIPDKGDIGGLYM